MVLEDGECVIVVVTPSVIEGDAAIVVLAQSEAWLIKLEFTQLNELKVPFEY